MKLTNFYEDYTFNPSDFDEVYGMLSATAEKINEYLVQLNDLRISGELEDFRIMPVQYINITPALYDTGAIFDSEELRIWNNPDTSLSIKTNMLYSKGKYIRLVANRGFANDESEDHKIIDFKLYDPLGKRMVHNVDYVYKNNILYILDYFDWDTRNGVFFKMTDVAIDLNTVNDMLGENLKLSYDQEKISKAEFNKIVRKLTLSAIKGSVVSAMTDSIAELDDSNSGAVRVVDKATTDQNLAGMWRDIFTDKDNEAGAEIRSGTLSPFDFLIYYPIYFSEYKVKLLKEYLDKVRHAYTNYSEFAYEPAHLEEYMSSTKISFNWFDTDLKPYLEGGGFVISDGIDEIAFICAGEVYYYDRKNGEIIDLTRCDDDTERKILDNNGIWVKLESFDKIFEEESGDSVSSAQEQALEETFTTPALEGNVQNDLFIHYALLGYELSRTGYNMILY